MKGFLEGKNGRKKKVLKLPTQGPANGGRDPEEKEQMSVEKDVLQTPVSVPHQWEGVGEMDKADRKFSFAVE